MAHNRFFYICFIPIEEERLRDYIAHNFEILLSLALKLHSTFDFVFSVDIYYIVDIYHIMLSMLTGIWRTSQ